MKKLFFGIGVLATMVASLTGCSKFGFEGPKAIEYHTVEFFCAAPGDGVRTVLMDSDSDGSRAVYWQVGDQILVFDAANPTGVLSSALTADDIFDSIDDETSKATLSPSGEVVGKYARFTVEMAGACAGPFYAFYGISAENVKSVNLADNPEQSSFDVVLPSGQKYHPTGFAQWENPAVAYCKGGDARKSFSFYNLCGILELKINKPENVAAGAVLTNVEIYDNTSDKTSTAGFLSGKFTVRNVTSETPELFRALPGPDGGGARNKNLVIEDNGIDADSYDLYFIAPVGSFHEGFTYILTYSDGAKFKQTLKASSKKVVGGKETNYGKAEILRGVITKIPITKAATPIADPQVPVQTANCYTIAPLLGQTSIPSGQTYAIPVGYKGNGAQGNGGTEAGASDYSNAKGMYCANSFKIEGGAKAEVLWQTKNSSTGIVTEHELISGIRYNKSKEQIIFTATGVEGNALVALKDASGKVLWSWHLWITNKTSDDMGIELTNGTVIMDRNLGALSSDPQGNELTYGQQYQWGRKDPFQGASTSGSTSGGYDNYYIMYPNQAIKVSETAAITLLESIEEPDHIAHGTNNAWVVSDGKQGYIGWTGDHKSLWDPCPVGWQIADVDKFFVVDKDGVLSPLYPGSFITEYRSWGYRLGTETKYSFLPAAGRGEVNRLSGVGTEVYIWSYQTFGLTQSRALHLTSLGNELLGYDRYYSLPVRCMKCVEPSTGVAAATTPTYEDGDIINL